MAKRQIDWVMTIGIAFGLTCGLYLLGGIACLFLNLYANNRTALRAAESLQAQHPNLTIRGSAGYESGMNIRVDGAASDMEQRQILDWLADQHEKGQLTRYLSVYFSETRTSLRRECPGANGWKNEFN
jgi:hypothetical protein